MSTIYFHTWCGLSVNLECRSETCCARLAENTACKKSPKSRHLGTIPQLCRAISSQLRHISTIGKKLLSSNISSTCPHNTVNFCSPAAEICWRVRGYPCKFQRLSRLVSVTARHSSIGRQPDFAALNRGRHLYSAGRPSRWALAHILVISLTDLYNTTVDGWSCHLPNRNKTRNRKKRSNGRLRRSVRTSSIARWKARERLPIRHN